MKNYLISYILYLISCNLSAQNTSFSKLYTVIPGLPCQADKINVCSGGSGYVIYAGTVDSNHLSSVTMLKTDTLGNVVWKKSYGKSGYNYYDVSLLPGGGGGVAVPWGGYIEIGTITDAARTWEKLSLYRFDGNGDTVWTRTYNDSTNELGVVVKVTREKNYIIGGDWYSTNFETLTLKKTDSLGNTIWQKTYHDAPSHSREGLAIDTCKDGGYIICAVDVDTNYAYACGSGIFIMKTDSVGTSQWTKYITDPICLVEPYCIISLHDGSYLVGAAYNDSIRFGGYEKFSKMYLAKFSSTGTVKWTKQYEGGSWDGTALFSLRELSNGDIVACGTDSSNRGCIFKTDSNGNQKWLRYYEIQYPSEQDYLYDIQLLADGGYVATGQTYGSTYNIWVIKVDSLGVVAGLPSLYRIANDRINVYPNPSNGQFTLLLSNINSACNLEIYNMLGEKVCTKPFLQSQNDNTINLIGQPNGVYLYRVSSKNGELIGQGKLVIQK